MPHAPPILPPFYYRDHFVEMIDFVAKLYGHLLSDEETAFIADFHALAPLAQCLYVRMINRRKAVFNLGDLDYREIGDARDGMNALQGAGFAQAMQPQDFGGFLEGLAKSDLMALAQHHGVREVKTGWAKSRLVDHLSQAIAFETLDEAAKAAHFVPQRRDTCGFLLYLYFGKLSENLTGFALRDLGLMAVRARESHQARFDDIDEARAGYAYSQGLKRLKTPGTVVALRHEIDQFPPAGGEATRQLRDKLLFRIGQGLERQKDIIGALEIYDRSTAFDSHERVVRLLYASGQAERARMRLDAMMADPSTDEEFLFASDFLARKYGQARTGVYTALLRDGRRIEVDELYRGHAEQGAVHHFTAQGWSAWHCENNLWTALFALLFREELFEAGGLGSDFDRAPPMLRDRRFHHNFADVIDGKLALVRQGQASAIVMAALARHDRADEGLFYAGDGLGDMLVRFLEVAPPQGVAMILRRMAEDFYGLRDGFPDLLLIRGDQARFVEIKAEGDQLRRHQLARLNLLREVGFEAEICRVGFRVDPNQTYVVIDVETTGGRPPNDRVTEIAVVKVRCGQVIGEWSSLINPQRRIPAFITDLTGISQAMVADAPVFADIADDLAEFVDGAIFVAHNVNFDYGFIAAEYRRLDRRFSLPKLCTVSSMRRHYPGLAAYGLAPLCRQFAIPLNGHHRALCDARAAAELLNLVNEKRIASQGAADDHSDAA